MVVSVILRVSSMPARSVLARTGPHVWFASGMRDDVALPVIMTVGRLTGKPATRALRLLKQSTREPCMGSPR